MLNFFSNKVRFSGFAVIGEGGIPGDSGVGIAGIVGRGKKCKMMLRGSVCLIMF